MTLMMQEILQEPETLRAAYKNNAETLNKIVKAAHKKKITHIVTAARGSSDNACNFFKYVCEIKAGYPVSSAAPSVISLYDGKIDFQDALVLGVSQSGKAADVMEIIGRAKKQGAVTVNITNDLSSPMAEQAEYHLFLSATEEKSVAATKTLVSQMYILALLAAKLGGDKAYEQELAELPDRLGDIFALSDAIQPVALRYKEAPDCYVLARGVNYAIAQETALKIQETTYVRAKAYAASDFHHGPFAVVDDKTHILLIAPTGESAKDLREMAAKAKNVGADITIFSDDAELVKQYDAGVVVPKASDFINCFYYVIVAQIFAQHLSLGRGLSPDTPRGLNKVTITK